MPIGVVCAGCKARLNAPDHAAGKKIKCPKCQAVSSVPTSVPAPPVPAPPVPTPVQTVEEQEPEPRAVRRPPVARAAAPSRMRPGAAARPMPGRPTRPVPSAARSGTRTQFRPPRRPFLGTPGGKAAAGGIGVVGILGIWFIIRVTLRVAVASVLSGHVSYDQSLSLPVNGEYGEGIEVKGSATYSLEVKGLEGSVVMSFGKVANPDAPTRAEIAALISSARIVGPGQTEHMGGSLTTGKYVWVVVNNGETPARCHVKFNGR